MLNASYRKNYLTFCITAALGGKKKFSSYDFNLTVMHVDGSFFFFDSRKLILFYQIFLLSSFKLRFRRNLLEKLLKFFKFYYNL